MERVSFDVRVHAEGCISFVREGLAFSNGQNSSLTSWVENSMITNIKANASQGPFLSKDDFILRSGASKTHAEKFMSLGILGDIPESNQLSLFDL